MDHAYYYAQHHSVLIFNCTPNIMLTVLCDANATAYRYYYLLYLTIKKLEQVISTNLKLSFPHHQFFPAPYHDGRGR